MTKTWALLLLQQVFPQDKPSVPYPEQTEIEAHSTIVNFLKFYSESANLPQPLSLIVRQVVQNCIYPVTRYQWIAAYADIMRSRIIGECNLGYCTESAQNAMDALDVGEWMVVSPADAVQGEMECWDD